MYLSKLRIFGFKSFPNRVEVNFPSEGITSVVGPNGCGKSNIIDAIRWVLGEQRPRALRSSKMEDVIFSGTAEKPAMNMAEVSLMVNNDGGVLLSDYAQVMVTRRAFRDGQSEYLINNQPCRLKDIHNLFYDTGMGAASYSLIEAKMIDSILSDKAEERRVMFEEAAGISKYKQQRKEAMRQLERTAQDLARVEDSLRHLQQNVNMFERQAKKAEKWRELKTHYRALELNYQYDSYRDIAGRLETLGLEQAKGENRAAELDARRATQDTVLEQEKLGLFEDEQQLVALNQKAATTQAESIRLESEAERCRDRVDYLEDSLRRLGTEAAESRGRLHETERQRSEAVSEAGELEGFLAGAAEKTAGARALLDAASLRVQAARTEADALGEERVSALEDLATSQQRLGASEGEMQHLARNEEEWTGEREIRLERLREKKLELDAANRASLEAGEEALAAQSELEKTLRGAEETGRELDGARGREQELRREKAALEAKHKLLQGLEASGEGVDAGVKYLMQSARDRVRSMLIDVLEVPAGWLVAVERALGKSLQTVLAADRSAGLELLGALRGGKKGEAAIGLPGLENFRRQRPNLAGRPGFRGWLLDQVRCPSEWSGVLEWALGHHALVDSLAAAFDVAAGLPERDFWLWTPEGDALHAGGVLYGGSPAAEQAGLLQRKSQLQEAETRLNGLEKDLDEAAALAVSLDGRRADLLAQSERLRVRGREAEQKVHEGRAAVQVLAGHIESLDLEQSQLRLKLESLAARKSELRRGIESLRADWDKAGEGRQTLENRFQSALEKAQGQEAERNRLEQEWRGLEQQRNDAEARLKSARTRAEFLGRSEVELQGALERAAKLSEESQIQIKSLREKMDQVADEISTVHDRLTGEERERDAAKSVYDAKASGLEEIRSGLRRLQDEARELTDHLHQRSLHMEQARAALHGIRERMFEIHEVDFDAEEPAFERAEYNPDTVADEIAELKDKLKSVGNINTGAVEEYEAEKAKLEEVRKQFDDLDRARLGLERAIKKLDKAAREQFLATFATVQTNFQEVFSSLFEGGETQLVLEVGADPIDAKIEINARPTGKKMRGVGLLSGGERALTAISLLFALYLVRPSPYCIMDEVDGPLDDANIGRFVNLLRRFSHQTQFIVVTHNKRTMAASDMLYGVTQEIKGISKLVSVQLDEAARIAA